MTTVRFRVAGADSIVAAPLRRFVDDAGVTLPVPATHVLDGETLVELEPSTTQWCWVLREVGPDGITRHVAVPDTGDVLNYEGLTDLDVTTFEPAVTEGVAAWDATLAAVQASADAAAASAVEAALIAPLIDVAQATADAAVPRGTLVIDVRDAPYSAVADGVHDDTAAIQAALDAAFAQWSSQTLTGNAPSVRVHAQGTFKVTSTILIQSSCDFSQAVFSAYVPSGVAVQVCDPAKELNCADIQLPEVINKLKTVSGWSGTSVPGSVGVRVSNLVSCRVTFGRVSQFETGICFHAATTNGNVYNTFFLSRSQRNKVGLLFAPEGGSWVNTNVIIGGSLTTSTADGAGVVSGCRLITIAANGFKVNDNKFIGVSLESAGQAEYFIDCRGTSNTWDRCRFENSGGPIQVLWGGESADNLITATTGTSAIVQVSEPGASNPGTATQLASYTTALRPSTLGRGGMVADADLRRPLFSPDGVEVKQVAFTDDQVSTMTGDVSPEGAVDAPAGTVYMRTDAGLRTNEAKYPVGTGVASTAGWIASGVGAISVGSGYIRDTFPADSGASTRSLVCNSLTATTVTAGAVYTISMQARCDIPGATVQLRARWYTAGSVQTGSQVVGVSASLSATDFTELPRITAVAPADATNVTVYVSVNGGPANTAGAILDARHLLIERDNLTGSFFDGSTPPFAGSVYAWLGTAQQSKSTATAPTSRPISYIKTGVGNTGWVSQAVAAGVTVPAEATDPASVQSLVNALRLALVACGIVS